MSPYLIWSRKTGTGSVANFIKEVDGYYTYEVGRGVDASGSDSVVVGFVGNPGSQVVFVIKADSTGNITWQTELDPAGSDYIGNDPIKVVVTTAGNIYITGSYVTAGDSRIFVVKLNSSGVLQWDEVFDSNNSAYGVELYVDASDNVYVYGTHDQSYPIVIKLNSSGTLQWQKKMTSAQDINKGGALWVDSSGNVFVTGAAGSDMWVMKWDSSGTEVWDTRVWAGHNFMPEYGEDIALDSSGDVLVLGSIQELTNTSYAHVGLMKLNSTGSAIIYTRLLGSNTEEWNAKDMVVDASDNVYVLGEFLIGGNYRAVVAKYDSSGTIQWKNILRHSTTGRFRPSEISLTDSDMILIAGDAWTDGSNSSPVLAQLPSDGTGTGTYGTLMYETDSAASVLTGSNTSLAAGFNTVSAGALSVTANTFTQSTGTLSFIDVAM